jgi:outer membrane protein assembly factor BamB
VASHFRLHRSVASAVAQKCEARISERLPGSTGPLATLNIHCVNANPRSRTLRWLLIAASLASAAEAGDWPQWRGPHRDGHAAPDEPAITRLPADLKPAWRVSIGPGFSSPIVAGGKVIFLDARDGREVVHALDPATGRQSWEHDLAAAFGDEWGTGPRSTPFADGDLLFVQSCNGEFQCLSLADGRLRWRTNFEQFGITFVGTKVQEGTAFRRGNNGSGVADEERVFVPVGSTNGAGIVAFDKQTGRVVWRALNEEAAYSSFLLAPLAGVPQLVAFTADALDGVDPRSGRLLWRVPFRTVARRHAATPVVVGDTVVVNSHTIGLVAVRITREGDVLKAADAWSNKPLKINLSTPVLAGGHLYSQGCNKDYVCVDATTGALRWSQPGFGRGLKDYCATIFVRGSLLVQTEDGQLVLLAASPDKCVERGRVQVCGATWCHPALAQGRLFVRDERELRCFDLSGL